MITARFISEKYLKEQTPISGNVDVADLLPFVDVAQEIDIQEVIGSKLYKVLMAAVAGSSVSADEADLLNLIRPMQAYYTLFRAIPFLQAKVRNKGVLAGEAEAAKTVDVDQLKWLRNEAKNLGEFYAKRLQDYLCENGKLFPAYAQPDNPLWPNSGVSYQCDLTLEEDDAGGIRQVLKRYLS